MTDRSQHWQKVYNKSEREFSWYQSYPQTSVRLIQECAINLDDAIIDVGGGDSHLVDALLALGYSNLFVLDISSLAIERAKRRLGKSAEKIHWIISDITEYKPEVAFSVWHDRATFHFLVDDSMVANYKTNVARAVVPSGKFILGTFSTKGPEKCSGLPVNRYSESKMAETFEQSFNKIRCFEELHETPFHTEQIFQFCLFRRQ